MTVEITINVPDRLSEQVQRFLERLPEILGRGVHQVLAESSSSQVQDENAIMALLAS